MPRLPEMQEMTKLQIGAVAIKVESHTSPAGQYTDTLTLTLTANN